MLACVICAITFRLNVYVNFRVAHPLNTGEGTSTHNKACVHAHTHTPPPLFCFISSSRGGMRIYILSFYFFLFSRSVCCWKTRARHLLTLQPALVVLLMRVVACHTLSAIYCKMLSNRYMQWPMCWRARYGVQWKFYFAPREMATFRIIRARRHEWQRASALGWKLKER